jgi:hypothetical protein
MNDVLAVIIGVALVLGMVSSIILGMAWLFREERVYHTISYEEEYSRYHVYFSRDSRFSEGYVEKDTFYDEASAKEFIHTLKIKEK